MKVVVDKYIPFLDGVLDAYADVEYIAPEAFTPQRVHEADALIVRTRTKVDSSLLAGSKVRFVATATIGYDHLDTDYLTANGIGWTACPGCNAQAVCDYVEEAISELQLPVCGKIIGIIGIGHVGSLVRDMALRKGFEVMENDAPNGIGYTLDEIVRKCDLLTLHVPLTMTGEYTTYHLLDERRLSLTKPDVCIINAARGGVVDEQALWQSGRQYVLDTWENEPHIGAKVVEHAALASYHIAGYSAEGKWNASKMVVDALCRYFGLPILPFDKNVVSLQSQKGDHAPGWLRRISCELKSNPSAFEQLRKQYKLR